eukprot:TRINITY_DN68118_c3_g1_i1.p1 TRINITY_DN68118_c3_g1~~TRINITY_DN68118_c3_g1_i1.p1  ORF type:complete len:196 (+),score=7.17 TRINITY_DN68118_c3_g1_i1:27-614(+)
MPEAGNNAQKFSFDTFLHNEGKRLIEEYGDDDDGEIGLGRYAHMNVVFEHPKTKGRLYVGDNVAASEAPCLKKANITNVVNCTSDLPLYHDHDSTYKYFRFQIYEAPTRGPPAAVLKFFTPVFEFIDAALERGESVLVHCLAGAHRAGTTGIAYLMHATGGGQEQCTKLAQKRRNVIDPIYTLADLLKNLEAAKN